MSKILFRGKKLKEIREHKGLTQDELALKSGLHQDFTQLFRTVLWIKKEF
jgi:transcriptional regulator with XRE-family HTH domain